MRRTTRFFAPAALAFAGLGFGLGASPVLAEVSEAHDDHFVTKAEAVVEATPKEAWLALISPARWWSSAHTWSADAANLRLTPQAGGCFCETIPETETADGGFTLQGSVEHMRVIQAYPEVALRMKGALGPLQSEPVTGILTIAISELEPAEDGSPRTRLVWEYNVGGKMRYPIPVISQAVDGVMTLQLTGLAKELGVVVAPAMADADPANGEDDAVDETADDAAYDSGDDGGEETLDEADAPTAIDPEAKIDADASGDAEADADDEPQGPSVDEAFDDLSEGLD